MRDYKEHAHAAIKEMHRQMGDELAFGDDGLLKRGLLIRLLVLPNDIADIAANLRWIRDELSPRTAISLMAQYYATNKAATDERYILLSRRISGDVAVKPYRLCDLVPDGQHRVQGGHRLLEDH